MPPILLEDYHDKKVKCQNDVHVFLYHISVYPLVYWGLFQLLGGIDIASARYNRHSAAFTA